MDKALYLFPSDVITGITSYLDFGSVFRLVMVGNARLTQLLETNVKSIEITDEPAPFSLPDFVFRFGQLQEFIHYGSIPLHSDVMAGRFPQTLRKLCVPHLRSHYPSVDNNAPTSLTIDFASMLPHLEWLECQAQDLGESNKMILPPTLTYLHLCNISVEFIKELPRGLESLQFFDFFDGQEVTEDFLFPPTLSRLFCYATIRIVKWLPPSVTILHLHNAQNEEESAFTEAHMASLPKNLTDLTHPYDDALVLAAWMVSTCTYLLSIAHATARLTQQTQQNQQRLEERFQEMFSRGSAKGT